MSAPRKQWCPVCGGSYQPGLAYAAHMRKHVREGRARERREDEYWYVGNRRHERTVTVFEAIEEVL